MVYPSPSRAALEDLWRDRLQIAQEHYRNAKHECESAEELQKYAAPADGSFSYRKTLRVENAALEEYTRVLRIFTDLTALGKMPPED